MAENLATGGQVAHVSSADNVSTSVDTDHGFVPSVGFEPTLDGF